MTAVNENQTTRDVPGAGAMIAEIEPDSGADAP